MIEIKDVSKTFGSGDGLCKALKHVTVNIENGSFTSIIGKSGSGKTTLLNLIGAVDRPDEGEILVNGRDITKLVRKELMVYRQNGVGIVYQFFDLISVLSVRDNILIANEYAQEVDKKYYNALIEKLDLESVMSKYPDQLSGGQKQRVAIARAMINRPEIILADEPTGNLDEENSMKVITLLEEVTRENHATLIMVTHDMEIASQADRRIELRDGRIFY